MLVHPINTINKFNFRANITPTSSLKKGFEMAEENIKTATMKNMNYAKEFLDSIARISESKQSKQFKIEIDKRREHHTYTKVNGRRVNGGDNDRQANIQDAYLVSEGIKRYASKLEEIEPSYLDVLKSRIEETEAILDDLKERYYNRLKSELEYTQNIIFSK